MAENEHTYLSATPWSLHLLDGDDNGVIQSFYRCSQRECAPEDQFLNGYEEPFDGFLAPFVDDGNDPRGSTDTISAWGIDQVGDSQADPSIPALGLMDCNVIDDRPNSSYGSEGCDLPNGERFMCSHCSKRFKSQSDVDRHRSSVHDKSARYLCSEQGCPRSRKGFTRKDNYDTHIRNVHRKLSKGADQILGRDINVISRIGPGRQTREDGLEGCSWEKLAEIVMSEREKCRVEQRRRQEVEEELKTLRQRYEEREDIWLKLLVTREGGK